MLRARHRVHEPIEPRGIREAARHVRDEVRALAPDIPWRRIVGVRNILIHGYLGIDNDIIWDIVRNEIAPLAKALEKLEATANRS